MVKIYLIRHAESIANTQGIYQGQTYNTGLSVLGKVQAKSLIKAFRGKKLRRVLSSPLRRTSDTAKVLVNNNGLSVRYTRSLIETNHGKWEGMNKEDIKEKYSETYKTWNTKPSETVFPEGEHFRQTVERVEAFLTSEIFDENTAIITHDNIMRVILCIIENKPIDNMWEYRLDPAGITEIEVERVKKDNFYRIVFLNKTKHLKGLLANIEKHAL